jgi:non-lysosomal glucosylceramidase
MQNMKIQIWVCLFAVNILMVTGCQKQMDEIGEPVKPIPYSKEELLSKEVQDTFQGDYLKQIAFPMGGIGTGCISLSGTGALVDWEIFNRANMGYRPNFTFLSLWAQEGEAKPVFRLLERQLFPPYEGQLHRPPGESRYAGKGWGPRQLSGSGLPRMTHCQFVSRFPFGRVELWDDDVPVKVSIEGWSPFIPGNEYDSSLPVVILNITLHNTTSQNVQAVVGGNIQNVCGWPDVGGALNEIIAETGFNALAMSTVKHEQNSPRYGTLTLATPEEIDSWQTNWAGTGDWKGDFMALDHFVRTFGTSGRYDKNQPMGATNDPQSMVGSIGIAANLGPGEEKKIPLIFAWHFPNFEYYWGDGSTWQNYYASQWRDAINVARYTISNLERLETETRLFQETFFSSTLPGVVLEAIASALTTLRTTTVTRLPDGTLYGFEGTHTDGGCCAGSCSHVWNYEQSLAYLFPALERSMREIDYKYNLRESDGHMTFRLPMPPGTYADHRYHAAADGQLGGVLRVYREWQNCGDDDWLKMIWPKVKKALEYAWVKWDINRDGLLTEPHHNTLDLEYHGPETMCGSMYQAALLAAEQITLHLGDEESAKEYRRIFESGKLKTDDILFNGEYYHQKILDPNAPYQFGPGCISEQLIGQWYARMLDLGDIYDRQNIHTALGSLFKYNYVSDFRNITNVNRTYALNDEGGILICSWPKGGRPPQPLLYSDETQIGYELQVAGNLLYEGYILEGLTVIKSIRDRFDGLKRNPYNEFECGNHYVRSMANYSALLALSGYRYSAVEKLIKIDPQLFAEDFRVFFSLEGGWGTIVQKKDKTKYTVSLEPVLGKVKLKKLLVRPGREMEKATAILGAKSLDMKWENQNGLVEVIFAKTVEVLPGSPLIVEFL